MNLLGIYDMMLAVGAIYMGGVMISGMFTEYPKEWISKIPFHSWFIPGIIAILLFGIGNIVASIFSLKKGNKRYWVASAIMGALLLVSLIVQVIVLGEWYMATVEFLLLSIGQLYLCRGGFASSNKN
ncbi:hypothetical protein KPL55_10285 [Clostridium lacusfryxellense]|nr:hypothetical protein [Clostridium lacusfryxellense]